MKLKYIFSLILVLTVFLSQYSMAFSDVDGHWAKEAIIKYNEYEIVKGYEDKFNPDSHLTRGDFAVILDRIMDYQVKAENKFNDLKEDYYTDAVLKLSAAKVIKGYEDETVRPISNITRQEAASMICRVFKLDANLNNMVEFDDADRIATWAKEYVDILASRGYVQGFDGKFNPQNNITRAEIVTILNNIIEDVYNREGTYTKNSNGTVVINVGNVTLKDMTVENDLILADGIADGDVTLDNIKVKGKTVIRGGGVNSIYITGDTDLSEVTVEKIGDAIRIKVENGTTLESLSIEEDSQNVIIVGDIENITLYSDDITVNFEDATVTNLLVQSENNNIIVNQNSEIDLVKIESENASISGNGKVDVAEVKNTEIKIETQNTNVVVSSGNGNDSSQTTKPSAGGGSGGGSSSSGGSSSGSSGGSGSTGGSSSSGGNSSTGSSGSSSSGGSSGTTVTNYIIEYEMLDGSFDDISKVPVAYTENSKTIMLPIPFRDGYIFDGWYEDNTYKTNKVIRIANGSTGNKKFYAKWTSNSVLKAGYEFSYGALQCELLSESVIIIGCDKTATEIVIPTTIYNYPVNMYMAEAFENCSELQKVELPENCPGIFYRTFKDCKNLEYINIPNTVKNISEEAFLNCSKLENISISTSVTAIGTDAFLGTKWLENKRAENPLVVVNDILIDAKTTSGDIIIPSNVKNINSKAFSESNITSVIIPNGITEIESDTFKNCMNLENISFPASITSIGIDAFEGTKWLENERKANPLVIVNNILIDGKTAQNEVNIPSGVIKIEFRAFYENKDITKIVCSDTLKEIEQEAFRYCDNLTEVVLTESIEKIGMIAFVNCNNLKTLELPKQKINDDHNSIYRIMGNQVILGDTNSYAEDYANEFGNVFLPRGTTYDIISMNDFDYLIINGEATVFNYYGNDTSITVPGVVNGIPVTKVAGCVFTHNRNITKITISENVEVIAPIAFESCSKLVEVNLPTTIKEIGERAFIHCDNLTSLIIPAKNVALGDEFVDKSIILFGIEGSTVEEYAEDEIEFYPIGTILDEDTLGIRYAVLNNEAVVVEYTGASGDVIIPSDIKGIPVTQIGERAFYNNDIITKVTIPNSIKLIRTKAFRKCSKLSDVVMSEDIEEIETYAFVDCDSLEILEIPAQNVEISRYSIDEGTILLGKQGGTLEENASNEAIEFYPIGTNIIFEVDNLGYKYAIVNGTEAIIIKYTGNIENITIPSEIKGIPVTRIGASAFSDNDVIKKVTIAGNIKEISACAFSLCSKLTEVVVASNVEKIGQEAFRCQNLVALTIQSTNVTIEDYLVYDSTILFGEKGSTAEKYATNNNIEFYQIGTNYEFVTDSIGLEYFVINDEAVVIGYSGAQSNIEIPKEINGNTINKIRARAFYNNDVIENVGIEFIKEIGEDAFSRSTLRSIEIPKKVKVIGQGAFEDCDELSEVNLEALIMSESMFERCESLEFIELPNGLTSIPHAFKASGLKEIIIPESVIEITKSTFNNCDGLTIYGYANSYAKTFANNNNFNFIEIIPVIERRNEIDGLTVELKYPDNIELIEIPANTVVDSISLVNGEYDVTLTAKDGYIFETMEKTITLNDVDSTYYITNNNVVYKLINNNQFAAVDIVDKTIADIVILDNISGDKVEDVSLKDFDKDITITIPYTVENIEIKSKYNIIVRGEKGSVAEEFANEEGYQFIDIYDGQNIITFDLYNNTVNGEELCINVLNDNLNIVPLNTSLDSKIDNGDGTFKITLTATNGYKFRGDLTTITFDEVWRSGEFVDGDFEYSLKDNELTIMDYLGSQTEIAIPEKVLNYNVVNIKCMFPSTLTKITISENIESISKKAFSNCSNVEIHGETNSYAEEFANEYGFTFVAL